MPICPFGNYHAGSFSNFFPEHHWSRRLQNLNCSDNTLAQSECAENTSQKFSLELDVAAFKPEELKVNLEGHLLTVEGHHEINTEHGYSKRSFTRQYTLPKDVDLAHIHTSIDQNGKMIIDAPKTAIACTVRAIPIHTSAAQAVTQKSNDDVANQKNQ